MDTKFSKLQQAYIDGAFESMQPEYDLLEQPSAQDKAFLGFGLVQLGRFLDAIGLLVEARSEGYETAAVFLGRLYEFQSNPLSRELLPTIKFEQLDRFGQIMLDRLKGMIAYGDGDLRNALLHIDRAWTNAASDPLSKALRPELTQMAASLFSHAGFDARAFQLLEQDFLQASPALQAKLRIIRVYVLINTGQFAKAQEDLDQMDQGVLPPSYTPHWHYQAARLQYFRGSEAEAAALYLQALTVAREQNSSDVETHAHLMLAALTTAKDDYAMARAHINRAQAIVPEAARDLAFVALRHGALLARQYDPAGLQALQAAREAFEQLGLERERGVALAHEAEALLRLGQYQPGLKCLSQLTDARHALGSGVGIAVELRSLPFVLEILNGQTSAYLKTLLEDYRSLDARLPHVLAIKSLGGYGLSLDGEQLRLNSGLARTVSLLVFLLEKQACSLEMVQNDVFDGVFPENARKHFHLIRDELKKRVPGLYIRQTAHHGDYSLQLEGLRVSWDAQELQHTLQLRSIEGLSRALTLYAGPFLPRTEGEWIEKYRTDLEWSVVRTGLEVVQDLYKLGELERACSLAERLFEVSPANLDLAELLVRIVAQLRGVVSARAMLEHLRAVFQHQFGEIPRELERIEKQIIAFN